MVDPTGNEKLIKAAGEEQKCDETGYNTASSGETSFNLPCPGQESFHIRINEEQQRLLAAGQ